VNSDQNSHADTNMMRIVHTALRRDLQRARVALTMVPPPAHRQRVALADHLTWMMAFLESHHRSEDLGLYPVVRERDPGAAALLDEMAVGHQAVAVAIATLEAAAAIYADRDERDLMIDALDRLIEVLMPHLQLEEDEMMPVVSRVVSAAEWDDLEQVYNLAGKSRAQLAREGHWLIDGASPQDRKRVLGLVPVLPRLFLLYGFGPAYRRHKRACWNAPRRQVQRDGSTAVVVGADIEAVWEVVRDPTRVGEWSHECVRGEWIGEVISAGPGARFRGRNRQGLFRWGRVCEVMSAEPYELAWRTVPTRLYPDSTEWMLRLAPAEGGTRIEQTFRVVKGTNLEAVYATLLPAHRDRTRHLTRDLERIGALARDATTQPGPGRPKSLLS